MTKVYKRQLATIEHSIFVSRTCDWCGVEMGERYGYEKEPHGTRELEIYFLQGDCYGAEGGSMSGWKVPDLCNECVDNLRVALEELGIKVQDAKREW